MTETDATKSAAIEVDWAKVDAAVNDLIDKQRWREVRDMLSGHPGPRPPIITVKLARAHHSLGETRQGLAELTSQNQVKIHPLLCAWAGKLSLALSEYEKALEFINIAHDFHPDDFGIARDGLVAAIGLMRDLGELEVVPHSAVAATIEFTRVAANDPARIDIGAETLVKGLLENSTAAPIVRQLAEALEAGKTTSNCARIFISLIEWHLLPRNTYDHLQISPDLARSIFDVWFQIEVLLERHTLETGSGAVDFVHHGWLNGDLAQATPPTRPPLVGINTYGRTLPGLLENLSHNDSSQIMIWEGGSGFAIPKNGNATVLVMACDDRYLTFALRLVSGVRNHGSAVPIHVHVDCVNLEARRDSLSRLAGLGVGVSVRVTGSLSAARRTCSRFLLLDWLSATYQEADFLIIDADGVIDQDPKKGIEAIQVLNIDLGVSQPVGWRRAFPWTWYAAGFVFVRGKLARSMDLGRLFSIELAARARAIDLLDPAGHSAWMVDQNCLAGVVDSLALQAKIGDISAYRFYSQPRGHRDQ